jgi:type I restriction enzyme S subunit
MKDRTWESVRLGSYCSKIGSGSTPRGGEQVYQSEGITLIRSQNVYNGRFTTEGLVFLDDEEASRLDGVIVEKGDVLLNITGDSVARCCQVPEPILPARVNQHVAIVRPRPEAFDVRFLKYFFISPFMQSRMLSLAGSGGTRKALTKEMIENFEIPKPDLVIQSQIADVLSTYDDLIENNRRRMVLLEEAARLLYQEWFVHLRFPGHEHTPKEEDLPKGWKRVVLKSLIDVTHGYAFQGNFFAEEPTSRVLTTPGNFRIGGGIKISKLKYYSDEGPLDPSYLLSAMDLIVTMTDLSKECDTLGFPAFVPKSKGLSFLHNQRVGKVVPMGQSFPKHFLYCLFCEDNYRHHIVGAATGTSVKHTSPKRILSYAATMPPISFIELFEHMVTPFFQEINCLMQSNDLLRTARDLLLPRLMSGEIEV